MIDYTYPYARFNDGAFYGNPQLKQDLMDQLQHHYDHDQIEKGLYWSKGKGCYIGCCIHIGFASGYIVHEKMSEFFGLPLKLCYTFDSLFEGMSDDKAMCFPLDSINAIPVGADLKLIEHYMAIWRLSNSTYGVINIENVLGAEFLEPVESILAIADLHRRSLTETVDVYEWEYKQKKACEQGYSASENNSCAFFSASFSAIIKADCVMDSITHAANIYCLLNCDDKFDTYNHPNSDLVRQFYFDEQSKVLIHLLETA
jgi:hypothetical protein